MFFFAKHATFVHCGKMTLNEFCLHEEGENIFVPFCTISLRHFFITMLQYKVRTIVICHFHQNEFRPLANISFAQ